MQVFQLLGVVCACVCGLDVLDAAPVRESKDILFVPANRVVPVPVMYKNPYQVRGPFDFIGNWIQQSDWFPIEVNIPDVLSGIGNGFQTGISNIQSGLQTFGTNISNLAGGFFQRIPIVSNYIGGNTQTSSPAPQRYFVMVPVSKRATVNNKFTPMDLKVFADYATYP